MGEEEIDAYVPSAILKLEFFLWGLANLILWL